MSAFDNHVCKCERCGELYTFKETVYPKKFKYHVTQAIEENDKANSDRIVMPVSPYNDMGLCPGCLKELEEWMEGSSVPPEDLRETPLAKAFREFAETVKSIKTGL